MNQKLIGKSIMIIGFVVLYSYSFLVSKYLHINPGVTTIIILIGAIIGMMISHGYYYARYSLFY
jgi:hypothetical protein